jgi:hypothetical protein
VLRESPVRLKETPTDERKGSEMATIGSASKRSLIAGIILVIVAGCTGSTTSSSATLESPTSASATPTQATAQAVTDVLNGGLYRFGPFGDKPSVTVVATGPNDWVGYPDWAMDGPEPVRADAPKGIGLSFFSADTVFSDPCHWDWKGTGQADVGDVKAPSVDAMVAALRATTYYTSTAPKPVTIDGYAGKELELQMPDGSYARCDKDDPNDAGGHVFVLGGPGLYTQGPANHWHLYILNVHGEPLIAVTLSYAKTPQKDVDTANKVIKTMNIKA